MRLRGKPTIPYHLAGTRTIRGARDRFGAPQGGRALVAIRTKRPPPLGNVRGFFGTRFSLPRSAGCTIKRVEASRDAIARLPDRPAHLRA